MNELQDQVNEARQGMERTKSERSSLDEEFTAVKKVSFKPETKVHLYYGVSSITIEDTPRNVHQLMLCKVLLLFH